MTDQLYTEKEAGERMTVSDRTVRRLRTSGQLGFVMVGGCIRYSEKEIARYLRSRERRARAA